jgi:hypothetical protein
MPNLKDNLKQWRDAARIDWFSQFIKAWIPFNAWMTDSFGDLTDRELLDRIKSGNNVVYNRIVPILTLSQTQAQGAKRGWQDMSPEGEEFRKKIDDLARLLQGCVVDGRKGRVSFETVDVGANPQADEQLTKWTRNFRVRRGYPTKGEVTLEMSASKTSTAFLLTQPEHNRKMLEDDLKFQALKADHRTTLLALHDCVAPRKVISVLAPHDAPDAVRIGTLSFRQDPGKLFSALVDITYSLRNALFHGSITPIGQHNEIYEPAYHIVLRFVHCTI